MLTSELINILVGIAFIIGIVGIYIPQYHKIYIKQSSHGLNNSFMILGNTATLLSTVNSIIYYINALPCSNCTEEFLGLSIITLQWLLFLINYILFLRYHPSGQDLGSHMDRRVTWGFIGSNIFGALCFGITIGFLAVDHWHYDIHDQTIVVWSDILEVLITFFFLLHYIPQIWETYRLRDIGSISLISLGIMCPGTFIWTGFLASQSMITNNPDASKPQVWVPYLIVGTMQLVLLVMGIYYEREKNKMKAYYLMQVDDEDQDIIDDDETYFDQRV